MKALIYDLEIKNAIQGRNETRIEGIDYCGGWGDHAGMGISVMGAYDVEKNRARVFCDDNKDEFFETVADADVIVGFNNIPFDNKVTTLCWDGNKEMLDTKSYDILREIWIAAGLPPAFNPRTHGGYGLDATCKANFGTEKSGNGALAPVLWQQGKIGAVIDYCMNDIALTLQLWRKIVAGEPLICPKTGSELRLRSPV